ncbi:MAG: FmdB family zinc ribbon protein [Burkholderiales bacterium]
MPLYDYHCASCGDFREIRPMTESGASQMCPICRAPSERVISAPFFTGKNPNGGTETGRTDQSRVSWRSHCGFGCSHSHHRV